MPSTRAKAGPRRPRRFAAGVVALAACVGGVGVEDAVSGTSSGEVELATNATSVLGTPRPRCVPFMGLKLAATGSTWWCEQLNQQPGTKVTEELFTSSSRESARRREARMREILAGCRRQNSVAGAASFHAASTEEEDDDKSARQRVKVRGFTISPKNSPGVRWGLVAASESNPAFPPVRVVKWVRSNVMKWAVSVARKSANVCNHKPNVKASSKAKLKNCGHEVRAMKVDALFDALESVCQHKTLLDAAAQDVASRGIQVYEMAYEAFQNDEAASLRGLYAFLLGTPESGNYYLDAIFDDKGPGSSSSSSSSSSKLIKKTPERLDAVIENYAEVASAVDKEDVACRAERGVAGCPLSAMLADVEYTVYPDCDCARLVACARHGRDLARGKVRTKKKHKVVAAPRLDDAAADDDDAPGRSLTQNTNASSTRRQRRRRILPTRSAR